MITNYSDLSILLETFPQKTVTLHNPRMTSYIVHFFYFPHIFYKILYFNKLYQRFLHHQIIFVTGQRHDGGGCERVFDCVREAPAAADRDEWSWYSREQRLAASTCRLEPQRASGQTQLHHAPRVREGQGRG